MSGTAGDRRPDASSRPGGLASARPADRQRGRGSPSPAAALAAPLAHAVAQDLEAIFPNAPPPRAGGLHLRLPRRGGPARGAAQHGARRALAAGALVAAAFVGVFAGALLTRGPGPESPVQPAASPDPRAYATEPANAAPVALASPGPVPGAIPDPAPVPTLVASAPPPGAAVTPRKAFVRKIHKASVHKASVHKAVVRRAPVHKISAHAACRGSRCAPTLVEADARLRRAYAAAIRADVPRSVLVDYRDAWEELSHRAPDQPRQVAARYSDMAGELNRMAARGHQADVPTAPAGARRRPRTQLAALWR